MADTRREWINKDNKDIAVEHVLFIYIKQVIANQYTHLYTVDVHQGTIFPWI